MESSEDLGSIRINSEVVESIARIAALEVEGVSGMAEGIVDGLGRILTRSATGSGVKAEMGEKEIAVEVSVVIEYGVKIPEVALNVQESVKTAVEKMTGLFVVAVNVNIQGVSTEKKKKI